MILLQVMLEFLAELARDNFFWQLVPERDGTVEGAGYLCSYVMPTYAMPTNFTEKKCGRAEVVGSSMVQ